MKTSTDQFLSRISERLMDGKITAAEYFKIGREFGLKFKEIAALKNQKPPHIVKDNISKPDLSRYGKVEMDDNSCKYGVLVDTQDAFVWIASPHEIANASDIHKTNY